MNAALFAIYAGAILLNCVTAYSAAYHIKLLGWPTFGWVAALGVIYVGAVTYIPLGAVALVDLAAKTDPQSGLYITARDIFFTANMALALLALVMAARRAGKTTKTANTTT